MKEAEAEKLIASNTAPNITRIMVKFLRFVGSKGGMDDGGE